MNKKIVMFFIITISIISFYAYFTRPVRFNDMVNIENTEDIEKIEIYAYLRQGTFADSKQLTINDKNDINGLICILNNHKYSKKFSFKNLIPGDSKNIYGQTNSCIQIFITSQGPIDQMNKHHFFDIDTNNTITVTYRPDSHWESEYRISTSDESIFEALSDWLKPFLEKDI